VFAGVPGNLFFVIDFGSALCEDGLMKNLALALGAQGKLEEEAVVKMGSSS